MAEKQSRISVELVPRDAVSLEEELVRVRAALTRVDTVNIPDLLRFPVRSWQGCGAARRLFAHAVPHIRAMDVNPKEPLPMASYLREHGIDEVLVVTGDPPQEMSRAVYPCGAVDVIKKFKREMPEVRVYAAVDPYRGSFRKEYDYIQWKRDAGADGFFTQPFFDVRLMEIFAEVLEGLDVFWGVTPVVSEKSRSYWETRNQVLFPRDFTPDHDWNQAFARKALRFVRALGAHVYFMPIRIDPVRYLQGVLGED